MEKQRLIKFHRFLLNQRVPIEQKVRMQGYEWATPLYFVPVIARKESWTDDRH